MGQVEILWKLQQVEVKLEEEGKKYKNDLNPEGIHVKIKDHKQLIEGYESQKHMVEDMKEEITILEHRRKDIDFKGQDVKEKLYGGKISDLKQLGVLLKEQEKFQQEINHVDGEIIELMETLEVKEEEVEGLKKEENKMGGIIKKVLRDRKEKKVTGEKIIHQLTAERETLLKKISAKNLSLYNNIKERKKNPVAVIEADICKGCHMDVPVMTITQLRTEEIVTCSNCGRILYMMDRA